jgi:hypothetical protein
MAPQHRAYHFRVKYDAEGCAGVVSRQDSFRALHRSDPEPLSHWSHSNTRCCLARDLTLPVIVEISVLRLRSFPVWIGTANYRWE